MNLPSVYDLSEPATRPVYTYTLNEPDTNEVRYVGKTDKPKERLQAHLRPSSLRARTYKNHWIKSLMQRGLRPTMTVVTAHPTDALAALEEIRLIKYYMSLGCSLTNGTRGGDGISAESWTADMRAAARKRVLGQKRSAELCERLSEIRRVEWERRRINGDASWLPKCTAAIIAAARNRTPEQQAYNNARRAEALGKPETRAKMRQSHLGKTNSPEARTKIAAANKGQKRSPESKARMSAACKERSASPEYRAKLAAASTGHVVSDETRAKMSANRRAANTPESLRRQSEAHMGQERTAETRAKIGAGLSAYIAEQKAQGVDVRANLRDPATVEKKMAGHRAYFADPANKANQIEAKKALWADPEWRAKWTEARRLSSTRKRAVANDGQMAFSLKDAD